MRVGRSSSAIRQVAVVALLLSTIAARCSELTTSPSRVAVTESDLTTCVTVTNQLRASVNLPPLTESATIERYAATAAQADALSGIPHGYSAANNGGTTGAWAENEALDFTLSFTLSVAGGTPAGFVQMAITLFWSEGPPGGHYQNIVGPYTQMGCGLYVSGPEITLTQDFR